MLKVELAKLKDYRTIRNLMTKSRTKDFRFYSDYNGNILLNILALNCYKIFYFDSLIGIFLKLDYKKQVLYIPFDDKNVTLQDIVSLLYNYFGLGYSFDFFYKGILDFNISYAKIKRNYKVMYLNLSNYKHTSDSFNGLYVQKMQINKEEKIRVELQNKIFSNNLDRRELTLKEILQEEKRKEFIEDLCYFLKYNDEYIGYGQIINSSEGFYLINFGIIPEFRGKGYAKYFLNQLILKAKEFGVKDLYLKVENNNEKAINLYKKIGFIEVFNVASLVI
ncbi:Acetyltransferase (GNAT) family protein [Caloramator fervidus]|uniref:Acetyltransferase (GNAT) family protein n=2 Tax=Caloramator fervidus TaxID=29344 RepID=A0A1H5S9I4_9CLOT|nr:Acetyltransferase (GNAT) family protein [Caloramator fervidus]